MNIDSTRSLGVTGLLFFGLAYMAPSIVVFTFGIIAVASNGTAPLSYLLATLAISLTALSYAKMSKTFPGSGSAYIYARKVLGEKAGFLVGWMILLDYLFLPMVAWLIQATFLHVQFPQIPFWVWLLLSVGLATGINLLGVKWASRFNTTFTSIAVLVIVVFVAYCVFFLAEDPPSSLSAPWWNSETNLIAVSGAAAIAAYSFLGFDAVSTMSDVAREPSKTVPRAILLTVILGGVFFMLVAYTMQLVMPSVPPETADTAWFHIAQLVGGEGFANFVNLAILLTGFTSNLSIQAGSSRYLYVLGREGVLPRRIFGRENGVTGTPVVNIMIIGAVGLLGLVLDISGGTSFINFGAFLAFAAVNLCVILLWWRLGGLRRTPSKFFLGLLLPSIGLIVDLYLLFQLDGTAQTLGVGWMVLGVLLLAVLTRLFRRPVPSLHSS